MDLPVRREEGKGRKIGLKKVSTAKDKYNFALYIPVIKQQQWENEAGKVKLRYTIKDPVRIFAGWLVKKSPVSTLELDELGSKAWLLIDGEKSVYEISKEINKDGKDTPEEALRRLVTFLRYLAKKGWITFKGVRHREDL
jgi:hypothetical protein